MRPKKFKEQPNQSEDILAALPHLTAAQVDNALSYYHDHRSKMDRLIEENRPKRAISAQGLRAKRVAEGVAIVHDETRRW